MGHSLEMKKAHGYVLHYANLQSAEANGEMPEEAGQPVEDVDKIAMDRSCQDKLIVSWAGGE